MQRMAIGLVVAALLLMPAAAGAQTASGCPDGPLVETYGGVLPPPEECPPEDPPADPPGGNLPFTGAETGLVGLAGMALLGLGIALRRLR